MKTILAGWLTVTIIVFPSLLLQSQKHIIYTDTLEILKHIYENDTWIHLEKNAFRTEFVIDSVKEAFYLKTKYDTTKFKIVRQDTTDNNILYHVFNEDLNYYRIIIDPFSFHIYYYSKEEESLYLNLFYRENIKRPEKKHAVENSQ